MNTKLLGISVALFAAAWTNAEAQTLIAWDVAGINASSSPSYAGTTGTHIDSGTLTLGTGLTASSAANTFGGSDFNQASFTAAFTNQDYIAFTITAEAGYALSLTSIDYLVGKSSGTTTLSAVLTSDRTGFTEAAALDTYTFSNSSPSLRSITLSGISSLQNITGTVEFRLYGISSSTDTFRIRNLSGTDLAIKGTVTAVPEPATTTALIGTVVLVGVLIRRRRANARAHT